MILAPTMRAVLRADVSTADGSTVLRKGAVVELELDPDATVTLVSGDRTVRASVNEVIGARLVEARAT